MLIGDRLTILRKSLGYNQIPFSKILGVSQSAYANYERNFTDIPISLAVKLCTEYEVSAAWLLLGTGQMYAEKTGDLVEQAAATFHQFCLDEDLSVTPERAGRLIRHLFEEALEGRLKSQEEQNRTLKIAT